VEPVEQSVVEATIPRVSPQVAAMIRLQWLTGMRPGEVVRMRLDEIDQAEEIWVYAPSQHKNLHRGHDRIIALGPKCQEVLEPFLQRSSEDYLFSPREADIEWRRKKRALRRSKITPSQRLREQRAARRARTRLGHHYDVRAYARAIARACKQAGLQHWSPNQLRHAAATRFRKEFDGDSARALLGHRSLRVTEIYAKIDYSKALRVMREIG
jgi:integrase